MSDDRIHEDLPPVTRPEFPEVPDDDRQKKRERARALIIGSLTAGGMFQLNGWQAQAHGNRSSHSVAAFQTTLFKPEDYVTLRERSLSPKAADTMSLAQTHEQLRSVMRKGPAGMKTPEFTKLVDMRLDLEKKLQLGSPSRPARNFLASGDMPGAITAIEGLGSPETVLNEYLWTVLDVAYLTRDGETFNASRIADFATLAKAAIAFIDDNSVKLRPLGNSPIDDAFRVKSAEVLHNIASFTLPDEGAVPDETLKMGKGAAGKALALRIALKQDYETMIAYWMVGKHELRAKDYVGAIASFQKSIEVGKKINSLDGLAWGNTYLARALTAAGKDPSEVAAAETGAREAVDRSNRSSVLLDLLKIDQGSHK